jgi:hypothetical protein
MRKTSAPQAQTHTILYYKTYDSKETNRLTNSRSEYKAMPNLFWAPQFYSCYETWCMAVVCFRQVSNYYKRDQLDKHLIIENLKTLESLRSMTRLAQRRAFETN